MLYIHRWVRLKDEVVLGIQTHDTISLKKNWFCSWVAKIEKNNLRCGSERDDHWWPCYWHTPNQWDMPNTKFSRTLTGYSHWSFVSRIPQTSLIQLAQTAAGHQPMHPSLRNKKSNGTKSEPSLCRRAVSDSESWYKFEKGHSWQKKLDVSVIESCVVLQNWQNKHG